MIQRRYIDINADVGEGIHNEKELMPYLSSCNIACGGHTGDLESMRAVVKLAKEYNVKIGAHPSYPDKDNFGRKRMDISCAALYRSLKEQIKSLIDVIKEERALLHHIKPHGALYNDAAKDNEVAGVIIEVMKRFHVPYKLYVPYNSTIASLAIEENIPIIYEAFADRNYNEDLSLVSRNEKNALITDPKIMTQHVLNMISNKKVETIEGVEVDIKADTFCIHGDNPNAIPLLKNLSDNLLKSGIEIL